MAADRTADAPGAVATYDLAAETYASALAVNAAAARRLVASLPAGPTDTVLDLGCGTGFASLAAIDLLSPHEVVGVDASREMLDRYRDATRSSATRVRAIEAPITAVPLPDAQADVAVATMVLQWVDDRPSAVREAARLLAPGGRLGLVVPAVGADREFHEVVRALDPPAPEQWRAVESARTIEPDALLGMLGDSGLEARDWWIEERRRVVTSERLVERMRLVGDHVFPEPPDDPDVWARIRDALVAAAKRDGFAYTFRKLFVIATRA